MSAVALLQAGGAGQRMGGATPKPLVPLLGVPLLERNLLAVLGAGVRHVAVAVRAQHAALRAWCAGRGRALAGAAGAELQVLVEATPRGTLGAAHALRGVPALLMLYGDNVFGLDWRAVLADHAAHGAAMTLPCHVAPCRIPWGRLVTDGPWVTDYQEKPAIPVPIASGCAVLGPAALAALPADGVMDTPALVTGLLAQGLAVRAYHHTAPWADVNHRAALAEAQALVRRHPRQLERFVDEPDVVAVGALLTGPDGVLLERRRPDAGTYPGAWDFPGGKPQPGEPPVQTVARELAEELGLTGLSLAPLVTFDDLDPSRGRWVRHVVFHGAVGAAPRPLEGQPLGWWRPGDERPLAAPARRALAWLGMEGT